MDVLLLIRIQLPRSLFSRPCANPAGCIRMGTPQCSLSDMGIFIGVEITILSHVVHTTMPAIPLRPLAARTPRFISPAISTAPLPRIVRSLMVDRAPLPPRLLPRVIRAPSLWTRSALVETGTRYLARTPEIPPTRFLHEGRVGTGPPR